MKKKIVSFIVALSMLSALVLVPLPSSAISPEDFTYTVNDDGTATITGYTGSSALFKIPGEINGYTVTKIGDSAFYKNKIIAKVILPNSVESIENYAFSGSSLTSLTLSKNLKSIGRFAFQNCNFPNIVLPEGLTFIDEYAFCGSSLTYVNLPSSLTTLNNYVFFSCLSLAYLRIPHTMTSISSSTFSNYKDLLVIVGCANSVAQTFAEENGFTFATIHCKDHTFSNGACTCCNILLGDLNKDGVVNMDDYTIIIGYVNDPTTCPDLSIADVNQDGVLDINDRLFLLEIISGASTWPE